MTMSEAPLGDLCRQCGRSVFNSFASKTKNVRVHVIYQQFSFGTVDQRDDCVILIYRMTHFHVFSIATIFMK